MTERDERPLAEIRFAQDKDTPGTEETVRAVFALVGVKVAQDIIDLGCTGLCCKTTLADAQLLRQSMAGSICGLPCYVPRDRFCLVHNTIGGLQATGNKDGSQMNPHPEGLALCSRELTVVERATLSGVEAFISNEGLKEAAEHFGAEKLQEATPLLEGAPQFELRGTPSLPAFICREHTEFTFGCRYCLAQSIVEGPLEPKVWVRAWLRIGDEPRVIDPKELTTLLSHSGDEGVELYVLAARWDRKLVKG